MDGRPQRLRESLSGQLNAWIALVMIITGLIGALFSFKTAFREANGLQDEQLRQVAALVSTQTLSLNSNPAQPTSHNRDAMVLVRRLGENHPRSDTRELLTDLSTNLPEGIQSLSSRGMTWRIFVRTLAPGNRIAVGQLTDYRDEAARNSALWTLVPLLILIPVLILVVGVVIKSSLRPIGLLSKQLDLRTDSSLTPLADGGVPTEIKPFVASINRLIARLSAIIEQQRRFIADAAHELRTPVTALVLQAENLARTEMSPEAKERLSPLRAGLVRIRWLLEQLLLMARSDAAADKIERVDLHTAVREGVEDVLPLAIEKQIDLGFPRFEEIRVNATAAGAKALVRNLLDNAVRYTPHGGTVDLSLYRKDDRAVFVVEDTGPGIAPEELSRVFDPFYRGAAAQDTGTGLGLSIVRRIAERLGGTTILTNRLDQNQRPCGLRIEYSQKLTE